LQIIFNHAYIGLVCYLSVTPTMKTLVTTLLLSSISFIGIAQVYVFAGLQQNYIRSEVVVNASPLTSWHVGGGINVFLSADQKKLSFKGELAFVRKGYHQMLANDKMDLHFDYLTYQTTVRFPVVDFFAVEGGVNLGLLVYSNMYKWIKTYNLIDLGFVGGLSFLENKRVGFYGRVVYGVSPLVSYERPDEIGNFHGQFRDLRNTCFMVGIRFKVYEKEFSFKH